MDSTKKLEVLTNEELAMVSGGLRRRYVEPSADGLAFKFGSVQSKFGAIQSKFGAIQSESAPLYDVSSDRSL